MSSKFQNANLNVDVGAPKLKLFEIDMVSFLIIVSPKRDRK